MPSPPGHSFYGGGGRSDYRDRDYNRGYGGGKGGSSRPRAAPIARPSTDYEEKLEMRAYGGDEKKRREEARRRDAEERESRRAAGQEADLGRSEAYWKMAAEHTTKVPYDRARIPDASVRASTQPPARASGGGGADKGEDPWSKLDPWGGVNTGKLRPKKEAPADPAPAAAEPAKPAAAKEEHWSASGSAAREAAAPPERPDSAWAASQAPGNEEVRWGDAGSSGYEDSSLTSKASTAASAADNWRTAEASAWQAPAVVWEEKAWEAKSWEAPATSSWDEAGWRGGKSWETSSVATSTWSDEVITRFGKKMAENSTDSRDYTREAKARRAALRKEESERRRREKEATGTEPATSSTSDPWKKPANSWPAADAWAPAEAPAGGDAWAAPAQQEEPGRGDQWETAAAVERVSAQPESDAWGKGPETLSLVLAGMDLSDADVEWRCEGWSRDLASGKVEWPKVLVVDLRDNNVTDKGLERLLCWLCEQKARPEQLLLSGNPLSEPVCLPHLLRHECGIKAELWRLELDECQLSQDVFRRCLETCLEVKRRPPLRWSLRRGELGKLKDCLDEAVAKGLRADSAGLEHPQYSPLKNLELDADVELVHEPSRIATFAEEADSSQSWAPASAVTAWQ